MTATPIRSEERTAHLLQIAMAICFDVGGAIVVGGMWLVQSHQGGSPQEARAAASAAREAAVPD